MRGGGGDRDGRGKGKGRDSTNGTNGHIYRIWLKYDRIRPYTEKIRSFTAINAPFTSSVFLRIPPYMVTEKYDRNTEPCNTEKYGRIRSVYSMYTAVYGIVYGRKRSYFYQIRYIWAFVPFVVSLPLPLPLPCLSPPPPLLSPTPIQSPPLHPSTTKILTDNWFGPLIWPKINLRKPKINKKT